MLINDEARIRKQHDDGNRIRNGKELYLEDVGVDGFSYTIDFETIIEYRIYYENYETSDGYVFKDSDWEAVYSYGV
jgi:hypothetical protein